MDLEQSSETRMSGRGDGGALERVERRRNCSDEEKLAILKETTVPGAIVSAVARRHSVGTGQLYTWRLRCFGERWQASCLSNWQRLRRRPKLGSQGGLRFEGGAA